VALSPADRAKAVFLSVDYGEAAAIDIFGLPLGLPPAISGHNNYYLWGPQGHGGSVLIVLGPYWGGLLTAYRRVEVAGEIDNPYAMPYETGPIYVLRDPKCRSRLFGRGLSTTIKAGNRHSDPLATAPPNMCRMHVRGAAGMVNMTVESQRRLDPRQRTCTNETTIRGSLVRGPGGY
jgi:hypothetical protein